MKRVSLYFLLDRKPTFGLSTDCSFSYLPLPAAGFPVCWCSLGTLWSREGFVWRLYGFPRNCAFQGVYFTIYKWHCVFFLTSSSSPFFLTNCWSGQDSLLPSFLPTLGMCFPFSSTVFCLSDCFPIQEIFAPYCWRQTLLLWFPWLSYPNVGILCLKYLLHAIHDSVLSGRTLMAYFGNSLESFPIAFRPLEGLN